MTTLNQYNPLLHQEAGETRHLTSVILNEVPVQAIFLLGSSKSCRKTTTLFSYDAPTASFTSHYYILVLIEKSEQHTINAVQDKIENNLLHFIPTTAIVVSTEGFFHWIIKGQPFASSIISKAGILYQSETLLFPLPSAINEGEINEEKEKLLKQAKIKTEAFLASAELHKIRQEYKLSAFMLHQALEQTLLAMLFINTGYRPNTHSIDKLVRYCSMFCYQLPEVFPKNNEKEKKLYALINKAYINTRYKDDYSITCEELTLLTEKVKAVKELFEQYKSFVNENCRNKIVNLK